jgi:hypothetical protein
MKAQLPGSSGSYGLLFLFPLVFKKFKNCFLLNIAMNRYFSNLTLMLIKQKLVPNGTGTVRLLEYYVPYSLTCANIIYFNILCWHRCGFTFTSGRSIFGPTLFP